MFLVAVRLKSGAGMLVKYWITNGQVVLCSIQCTEDILETLNHFTKHDFYLYIQWLNPGFSDLGELRGRLVLLTEILSVPAIFSICDAKGDANVRATMKLERG